MSLLSSARSLWYNIEYKAKQLAKLLYCLRRLYKKLARLTLL